MINIFYYSINIQFVKSDAPTFTEIKELIEKAITVYNSKSMIAANPKQIVEKKLKDDFTLEVVLESTNQLKEQMASKALRVFSTYLITGDPENNLSSYISGKRLFKMSSYALEVYEPKNYKYRNKKEEILEESNHIDELDLLQRITVLLKKARYDNDSKNNVVQIYRLLTEEEGRRK